LKQSEENAHCSLFVLDISPLIFSAIAPNHESLIGCFLYVGGTLE
jgi:hypothetical protein